MNGAFRITSWWKKKVPFWRNFTPKYEWYMWKMKKGSTTWKISCLECEDVRQFSELHILYVVSPENEYLHLQKIQKASKQRFIRIRTDDFVLIWVLKKKVNLKIFELSENITRSDGSKSIENLIHQTASHSFIVYNWRFHLFLIFQMNKYLVLYCKMPYDCFIKNHWNVHIPE